jgi:peptidoglycan/LPS O-acetylase OafA/YrhL
MSTGKAVVTPTGPSRIHWVALDGIRAFAVVTVMIYHMELRHVLTGGLFGVDVFFLLSGFLITTLLIGEAEKHEGRVHLGFFYARRALRLLPALAAVIAVSVVAVLAISKLHPVRHDTLTGLPWVVLYGGNWLRAVDPSNGDALGLLGHTWSLAIEEQFYLVWPLPFVLFASRARSRRKVAAVLGSIVVVEWVYRAVLIAAGVSGARIGNGTDTHSDGLILGCALAFWVASKPFRADDAHVRLFHVGAVISAVVVAALFLVAKRGSVPQHAIGYTVVPVATAVILWDQLRVPLPAFRSALTWGPVVWIGKRSYGLYLWHYPIYVALSQFTFPGPAPTRERNVFEFVLAFAVAALSYWALEARALRLKTAFQRTEAIPQVEVAELGD